MTVLVAGGGIAGLVAAWVLARERVPVTLVEAGPRLGGKIATERVDGFVVEAGPDSFLTTRPAALELCRELGLGDRLVETIEPRTVRVLHRGRLVPMPDGFGLAIPTRIGPFATTPLFSPLEKVRLALDLVLPRGDVDGDEAVGGFLRRRLGDAFVERLAGPLIGGIHGTDIDELSLLAVLPQLREAERAHRSLLLAGLAGFGAQRARDRSAGRSASPASEATSMFMSLTGGMAELTDALAVALAGAPGPADVRTSTAAAALGPLGAGYLGRLSDGSTVRAEAVVLAAPAPASARLLEPIVPAASARLRAIPFGSAASVALGYREGQFQGVLADHGFVVADGERVTISACTWSSAKWPGRAPEGHVLLRAFPRTGGGPSRAASDDELVAGVRADLERTMGVRGDPILARVSRFHDAMPRYTVGHLERVAAAEAALAGHPGLVLAGASYRGVGLPDCVTQGRAAAARVLEHLGGRRR